MPADPPDVLPTSEVCPDCGATITQEFGCKHRAPFRLRQINPEAAALESLLRVKVREIEGKQRQAIIDELASGGDAAIREAVDRYGSAVIRYQVAEPWDWGSGDEVANEKHALLALFAAKEAQRAAEAARVRDAALEEAEGVAQDEYDKVRIRALREATRG